MTDCNLKIVAIIGDNIVLKILLIVAVFAALAVIFFFLYLSFKLLRQTQKPREQEKLINPQQDQNSPFSKPHPKLTQKPDQSKDK